MMGIVSLCQRIEKESSPRVQFDRLHGAGGDLTLEIFLNDLVEARAYVPESLKREFLMTWADEPIIFRCNPGGRGRGHYSRSRCRVRCDGSGNRPRSELGLIRITP